MRRASKPLRAGISVLEMTVGATLVALLLASAVQVIGALSAQQRAADRRALALAALDNVLEELSLHAGAALAAGVATEVALPESIMSRLPGARVDVIATDETEPFSARRITASITWIGPDRNPIPTPLKLTTWVDRTSE